MAEINVSDITTIELNGTGVFDVLMQANQKRLDEEYSKNRIKGPDYSKVYLGGMEAVMQQSIVFLLGKQKADKEADLIDGQLRKIEAEILQTLAQVRLVESQIIKVDAEILLIEQQIAASKEQTLNLAEERKKIIAEVALIEQNTVNAQISATNLIRQQAKLEAEAALLTQKRWTEEAQTLDTANSKAVVGVIGKQKVLYQAQTDGFARDAEQKLAKIMSDSWSVRRTTDEAENPAGTGLTNTDIQKVMAKAKTGIGA